MTTSHQIEVAAGNEEQYAAWNGDEGERWVAHPEFFDASVRNLQRPLMEAAGIRPGDHVLDVGCGSGQCTREAARRAVDGTALGIDLSQPMIRVAEVVARREGLANAGFVVGDAQIYPFPPAEFDVALGRSSTMFFADQVAAFANIARALRPGGRLALVSWRSAGENEWISALSQALRPGDAPPAPPEDAPTPFRHADPDRTAAILTAAGFEAVSLQPLDVPMYFGRDAEEGFPILRDLLGWMVRDLEPAAAHQALDRMRVLLDEHETADGVAFGCAAWLITARRRLAGDVPSDG
jgi:SAM-dependent methyltransferase